MPVAFITGVTGQDGGYLAEQLTAEGYEVHGLVRSGDASLAELVARSPSVLLHEGDLGDPAALADLVIDIAPDEVYNLGGLSSVALSWEQPLLAAQVSGVGAAGLLEAAWKLQEKGSRAVRVVQASSAEMFGEPTVSPQDERTTIRPTSPYGAAKAFAQNMVAVYRARGLHAVSAILYNHESPRRPPQFVTRKITLAAAQIAEGKADSLSLGNLNARRDWGWAPEYVEAMVLAARHDVADDYVIATGVAHSVEEFVAAAFAAAGIAEWQPYVTIDPRFVRPVDATELVGDPARAQAVLGWQSLTPFEELVARMVDHDRAAGSD
jgi:GDPmannose 4,6-dehydratase